MPDLKFYEGREQGFVKHSLIEKYLERFAIKISRRWDEIVYIDAFAGPWKAQTEDLSDTSFGIALDCLKTGIEVAQERFRRHVRVRAILVERRSSAFARLEEFAEAKQRPGFRVTSHEGAFEDAASKVREELEQGNLERTFVFALIDPKGWTGLSMEMVAPLVRRRSAEVLVNVMTWFIHRFVDVESCRESYEKFFGRRGVREIIRETAKEDRQDAVVREYCRSLKRICRFEHVSSCVILEPDKNGVKYFMVFATNDPMGIKVFKEAEAHAAMLQDDLQDRRRDDGNLLLPLGSGARVSDRRRARYGKIAFERVEAAFLHATELPYADVFCTALAMPLVTEAELIDFLETHPKLRLSLDGKRRKRPDIGNLKDRVRALA